MYLKRLRMFLLMIIIFCVMSGVPVNAEIMNDPLPYDNFFDSYTPQPLDLDTVFLSVIVILRKVLGLLIYVFYVGAIIATIFGLIMLMVAAMGGGLDARKKAFTCFTAVIISLFIAQILIPFIYANLAKY